MKLRAGYCIESLKSNLESTYGEPVSSLMSALSVFDYEVNTIPQHRIDERHAPILKVVQNLISRGAPTRMSLSLEKKFAELLGLKTTVNYGSIQFGKSWDTKFLELAFQALHAVDPRIEPIIIKHSYKNIWEGLESAFEEDFLFNQLGEVLGGRASTLAVQITDIQRFIDQLADKEFAKLWFARTFNQQRADFVIDFPYPVKNHKGFIIEVDGPHHDESAQEHLDNQRDEATRNNGWYPTIRIKTREWHRMQEKLQPLKKALSSPVFEPYLRNLDSPLYDTPEGLQVLTASLSPIAIARIQRTVLELIFKGNLSLKADSWRIAVVERDVQCAHWAFEDFKEICKHLFGLADSSIKLPRIDLKVCRTTEFNAGLGAGKEYHLFTELRDSGESFDLLLDISVLRRDFVKESDVNGFNASTVCVIRSAKCTELRNYIGTDIHVQYRSLSRRINAEKHEEITKTKEHLEFFLQWIFRKEGFRSGQLPILNRALQAQSVIGLLPTGGGKSLTYQLAALLQPGVTLVVDPIKSLMKDQTDGLKDNLIDSFVYINSSVKGKDRERALECISDGEAQFVFVSPERLQIKTFRALLEAMYVRQVYFNYCVIDEAHCVSEWGHDFRTSYLSVGVNARRYCSTKNKSHIPIFGLTATASFDVLADVQRELSPFDDDPISDEAIIRYSVKRPELQYRVIEVKAFDELEPDELAKMNDGARKICLAKKKKTALNAAIKEIPEQLSAFNKDIRLSFGEMDYDYQEPEEENTKRQQFEKYRIPDLVESSFFTKNNDRFQNAGVVFCPHRTWHFGVTDKYRVPPASNGVADSLNELATLTLGSYLGASDDDEEIAARIEHDNDFNQTAFKRNQLGLLVATKAFGMGVDKPNIRYSFHFNYPQSIESFVQEAGRAGRDGKLAMAHVLFNDEPLSETYLRDSNNSSGLIWETSDAPIKGYKKIHVPYDAQLVLDFHNSSFQGQNKEKRVLAELLTELRGPTGPKLSEFSSVLPQEINVRLSVGDAYLFVNGTDGEQYGGLSWLTVKPNAAWATTDKELALSKLNVVRSSLIAFQTTKGITNLQAWFFEEHGGIWPSIEDVLDKTKPNSRFELTIPFTADLRWVSQQIKQLIADSTEIEIAEAVIRGASSNSFGSFMKFLSALYKSNPHLQLPVEKDPEFARKLESRYYRYRQKSDTEKAIYRLHCIRVLDDYSVDFNSNTFIVSGIKHDDDYYRKSLRSYIRRYYSESRADRELENFEQLEGANNLRKCLNLLIDFVYREIERKRFMAIKAMREACIRGADSDKGNVEIKEYIHLYFFSKYAREEFRTEVRGRLGEVDASLLDRTNKGQVSTTELIWDFIEIADNDTSGPQLDNFKHLRGACTRILIVQPSNYTLLLLQAFAQIFIEFSASVQSSRQLEIARDSLMVGLEQLEMETKDTDEFFKQYAKKLHEKVGSSSGSVTLSVFLNETRDLYQIRKHVEWTKKFNKQFDYGNERADSRRAEEIKN